MLAILPKFFSFKSAEDLTRVGKNNDGGYLISKNDMNKSDMLMSLGIFDAYPPTQSTAAPPTTCVAGWGRRRRAPTHQQLSAVRLQNIGVISPGPQQPNFDDSDRSWILNSGI